jgi:hypothetical protein
MSKFKREVVHGQPIQIGSHEVVPEAEVWSWQLKDVTLPGRFEQDGSIETGQRVSVLGALWTWVRPTALIERDARQTRRIRIVDRNRKLELILLMAGVLLPIVLNAAALLARPHSQR